MKSCCGKKEINGSSRNAVKIKKGSRHKTSHSLKKMLMLFLESSLQIQRLCLSPMILWEEEEEMKQGEEEAALGLQR